MPASTTGDPASDEIPRRFQRRRAICLWLGGPWFAAAMAGVLLENSGKISGADLMTFLIPTALVLIPLWVLLYRCPSCRCCRGSDGL